MIKFKIGDRLVQTEGRYEIVRTKKGWIYTRDNDVDAEEFEPSIFWAGDGVVNAEIERGEYA